MRYYAVFLVSFLSIFLSLPIYNYVVDWYGVFQGVDQAGKIYIKKRPEQSASAQNVQHPYFRFNHALSFVKENQGKCILVMGSSRVEALFNDADMTSLFKIPFSKLQYNNSPIEEALHNVRLLASNDAMPQRLIIGIDDFSLFHRGLNTEPNRMPPPLGIAEQYTFWKTMFYRWPSIQNLEDSFIHPPVAYNPLSAPKGRSPIQKVNANLYLLPSNDNYQGKYYTDEAVQDIAGIISIAKQYNTQVDFFITPRFVSTYYMRDHESLHDFKRKLAKLTAFYDFSGVVYENISPRFWLETSHQTNEIGLIVGGVINSGGGGGFWGRLVNEGNVEAHLQELKNNLAANIDSWLAAKPDGDIHPKLYAWLFPQYKSTAMSLSSIAWFDSKELSAPEKGSGNLTSVASSVTIKIPPILNVDRLQFSIIGAPKSFYSEGRARRYIDLSVNDVPYGQFMFGVTRDGGAVSNEKIITLLGDFSQGTVLSFSVRPEKISAGEVIPGFTLEDKFNAAYTGNTASSSVVSFDFPVELPASVYSKSNPVELEKLALNKVRLDDLNRIASALERYRIKNKGYPVSSGWDGLYTRFGASSPNWIAGLTPSFIDYLPRDPRNNNDGTQQYLYRSNGHDYKLIAHGVDSFFGVGKKMVDVRRPNGAFGIWTKAAVSW